MRTNRALFVALVAIAAGFASPQSSQAGCCLFDWLFHRSDPCCPPATYSAGYGGACCNTGYATATYRPVFRRFALFRPWTTYSNPCCAPQTSCCAPQTTYRPIFSSAYYGPSNCCATPACGSACGGCNSCGSSSYYPSGVSSYPSTISSGNNCCAPASGYAPSTVISPGGIEPTPADNVPRTFSDDGANNGTSGGQPYPTNPAVENNGASNLDNSGTHAPIRIQDPNNRVTSAPRNWTFRPAVARSYEVKPRLIPVQSASEPHANDEGWSESDR